MLQKKEKVAKIRKLSSYIVIIFVLFTFLYE